LRHITLYGEAAFISNFFVDGWKTGEDALQLGMEDAETFFKTNRYPQGFFRANNPSASEGSEIIFAAHPTVPGKNVAGVNAFTEDQSMGNIFDPCKVYTGLANTILPGLYPNPTGVLRRNLKINLQFLYDSGPGFTSCPQQFTYGA